MVRALLTQPSTPDFSSWHNSIGGSYHSQDSPLSTNFHLSALSSPKEISWGNTTDHRQEDLLTITLLTPDDPKSREKAYRVSMLAQLIRDG